MNEKVNDLKRRLSDYSGLIGKSYRCSMYTALLTGFIAYIYIMTHNIHNYDNIFVFPQDNGTGVGSGRWFLHIMNFLMNKKLFNDVGYFHTTVINTVFAVFLVEICCLLIISIFELYKPIEGIAITAATIAFPTIGATMIYNYTVAYYMVGSVLCTLALWLIKQEKWYGDAIAILLIAMGLGTYQSYFPYTAALMILLLLQQTIVGKSSIKIFADAWRYLGMLIVSWGGICRYKSFLCGDLSLVR